ncbi:sigma-70 family RNA polymerase sigma factor [Chitinophaga agrisoli]|uniref:Sigma-70 family RNA polymerase sigma factor n=1 Tax=Chitinophaga agrisoli TaxID=2607653 RepID=A0A5B2VT41_9BACT|nr:sigma-70 family RNA polymerase sigma factor [Chitinophaga agrisoli]KAA2241299.1 sigma-70 family RNA polymerase sigma factor [Chitinophaga agrisoli]
MGTNITLTQDDLVRFQAGDHLAFSKIFDGYYDLIFQKVFKFCQSKEEAEEITQEAFIQLFIHRHNIQDCEGFFPYLYVTAKRLAISFYRKKIVRQEYQAELKNTYQEHDQPIEAALEGKYLNGILTEVLEELPPQQQMVYRMNKLEGYSYQDIAERAGLSRNTVRNHLSLASKFIRLRLEKILFLIIIIATIFF